MRFFQTAVSLALAAFAAVASAQAPTKANAITAPISGAVIEAGETFDIKWMNVVGETVTLVIMDGAENQLKEVRTIATNIPNNGAYTWSVPEDLPASGTYTIRISYDRNPNNYNYSDRFAFVSDFVSTSSAASSTAAPTTTSASSSAASTTESSSSTETTSSAASTTVRTSTSTRRTTTTESTGEPTSQGAPPSAGTTTLSSPLAVIMAVLAATLFIH